MVIIGIDIGTSSICGAAADPETGTLLRSVTRVNDSSLQTGIPFASCQDPDRILQICDEIYRAFLLEFSDIKAIGFTGQMHGMLYLGKKGRPLSPLYTWQDGRGNEIYRDGRTYAQELTLRTGFPMATGYGLTTLFYDRLNGKVPEGAYKICTIHDYVAMRFCGLQTPIMHISDAASFGLFDLENLCFSEIGLQKAQLDFSLLPELSRDCRFIGQTEEKIPVCIPVGDNQASVLGSLCENAILVNIGTGSQISAPCKKYTPLPDVEYRPYFDGKYLVTGCALAGGYAYSLLKNFFAQTMRMFGKEPPENIYEYMDKGADEVKEKSDKIVCLPYFCGTRNDPVLRASFCNIGAENFTPQSVTLSVLNGICEELYGYYGKFSSLLEKRPQILVGSGNGIRKNPLLADLFSERFSMPLRIPLYEEEAAFGSVYAAYMALKNISSDTVRKLIRYR